MNFLIIVASGFAGPSKKPPLLSFFLWQACHWDIIYGSILTRIPTVTGTNPREQFFLKNTYFKHIINMVIPLQRIWTGRSGFLTGYFYNFVNLYFPPQSWKKVCKKKYTKMYNNQHNQFRHRGHTRFVILFLIWVKVPGIWIRTFSYICYIIKGKLDKVRRRC